MLPILGATSSFHNELPKVAQLAKDHPIWPPFFFVTDVLVKKARAFVPQKFLG
jgi:hypothetical protein